VQFSDSPGIWHPPHDRLALVQCMYVWDVVPDREGDLASPYD
jgi:hypothetical protein